MKGRQKISIQEIDFLIQNSEPRNVAKGCLDAAKGCMLGAFIGDAIGAPLEFKETISVDDALRAMTMPGGGVHRVGRGQVTDDSELAISLAHGLLKGNGTFDIYAIVNFYRAWLLSSPFDIGKTINGALMAVYEKLDVDLLRENVKHVNFDSQSNGSLMRLTPLCIWIHNLSEEDKISVIREEVLLTHCHPLIIECAICYALAISSLIKYPRDNKRAFAAAKNYAMGISTSKEIKDWIKLIEHGEVNISCKKHIGWAKIAFIHSFRYLLDPDITYMKAIFETIYKGGDTDTNAAIVGGMIGALTGEHYIPWQVKDPVLTWSPKLGGQKRPKFLIPGNPEKDILTICEELYNIAPKTLNMKGESKGHCVDISSAWGPKTGEIDLDVLGTAKLNQGVYVNSYAPSCQEARIVQNKEINGNGRGTGTGTGTETGTYNTNETIIVESTHPPRGDLGLLVPLEDEPIPHGNGNGNTKANSHSQYSKENFTKLQEELAAAKQREVILNQKLAKVKVKEFPSHTQPQDLHSNTYYEGIIQNYNKELKLMKEICFGYINKNIRPITGTDYHNLFSYAVPSSKYIPASELSNLNHTKTYLFKNKLDESNLYIRGVDLSAIGLRILKTEFQIMSLCSKKSEYIMSPLSLMYNTNYAIFLHENAGIPVNRIWEKEKLDPILAFYQLAQGLQAIHSELNFHGDIKPQNIFYKNNIYTFTDFGSSRHFSSFSDFDVQIRRIGTTDIPGFTELLLPPEILWGGDYTTRPQYDFRNIDIFSLALSVYSMVIRRLPNEEAVLKTKKETYREFMEKIYTNIEKNKFRLDMHKYEIFKDLVMKCLNLNPNRRCPLDLIIQALE